MKKHNHKKLEIYQRSLNLARQIIPLCDSIRPFKLSDQIASSCVSIPSNITEGACRSSITDFKRFLDYSTGSAAELETQLLILQTLENVNQTEIEKWINEVNSLFGMIQAFKYSLKP